MASRGDSLERLGHDRSQVFVRGDVGLAIDADVPVALGSQPHPAPLPHRLHHAALASLRAYLVVELGDGGEDALGEAPDRRVLDALPDGIKPDLQAGQERLERSIIVAVAGKAVDLGDDDHLYPSLVLLAVGEHLLEDVPVVGLGALTALDEDPVQVVAGLLRVLVRLLLLRREGVSLVRLAWVGYPAVGYRCFHAR